MIKVLHYIPGFLYGGIESMFLSWYKNIEKRYIGIELLLRTQDDEAPALQEYRNCGGVYYRLSPITDFFSYVRSVNAFFKTHHDYDILHVHEADPLIMKLAKKYGIKKILLHSHSTNTANSMKEKIRVFDEKMTKYLYTDYGLACSKLAAQWKFGGYKFKKKPVIIIHNAIDSSEYEFNPKKRYDIREKLIINDQFVVGHIGRMTYPKNQFFLLDIFKKIMEKVNESILILVGDGPDEDKLKKYARDIGIEKKVLYMGVRKDIPDLLQAMDCFLLPSRYEGLPVTLVEAQAAGLPCFISNTVSTEADIVSDLIFRKSITEKPEVWADEITYRCENKERRNVRQRIIDGGYDITFEVKKLERNYQEFVEEIR